MDEWPEAMHDMCLAMSHPPDHPDLDWICTRLLLHAGPHQAGMGGSRVAFEWENNGEMKEWPRGTKEPQQGK